MMIENLKTSWLNDHITFLNNRWYLRYDTMDSTAKENFDVYCDIQEELRDYGFEIEDPYIEHDCITGFLKIAKGQ